MYHHASCENHGCEAIIRTVSGIIDRQYPGSEYTVTTKYLAFDGKTTADTRNQLQLDKGHYIDAYCISLVNKITKAKIMSSKIYKKIIKVAKFILLKLKIVLWK